MAVLNTIIIIYVFYQSWFVNVIEAGCSKEAITSWVETGYVGEIADLGPNEHHSDARNEEEQMQSLQTVSAGKGVL